MKTFATICLVLALLVSGVLLFVVEKFEDRNEHNITGAVSCDEYVCNSSLEQGSFCRISTTGYRAYPYVDNNTGYRDCINRSNGVRGTWSVIEAPLATVEFTADHCLFLDNVTMCFRSSDPTENALILQALSEPS